MSSTIDTAGSAKLTRIKESLAESISSEIGASATSFWSIYDQLNSNNKYYKTSQRGGGRSHAGGLYLQFTDKFMCRISR